MFKVAVTSLGSSSFTVLNCTSMEISLKTGQKDPFSLPQRKPCGHICLVFPNFFKIMSCVQKIACALMVLLATHEKLVPATLNLYKAMFKWNNLLQNKIFAICALSHTKLSMTSSSSFLYLLLVFCGIVMKFGCSFGHFHDHNFGSTVVLCTEEWNYKMFIRNERRKGLTKPNGYIVLLHVNIP